MLNAALAEQQAGRLAEAEARYRRILARWPDLADANNLLGLTRHQRGDLANAIDPLRRAVRAQPAHPVYRFNLGNVLAATGDFEAAESELREATRLNPSQPEIPFGLGTVRLELGRLEDAATAFRLAIQAAPGFADAHYNLGLALARLGRPADAIDSYGAALRCRPDHLAARYNLGNAQWQLGRLRESLASYDAVLGQDPRHAGALLNAARSSFNLGWQDAALERYRQACAAAPDWPAAWSARLYALGFDERISAQDLHAEHASFSRRFAAALPAGAPSVLRDCRRPLRVGFVSPDFRVHSCAYFIEPLWRTLDRDAFEIHAYSDVTQPDAATDRLATLTTGWRNVSRYDDAALAEQIRDDRIDILFDLAGHTDRNRLLVFARKPAPVQVTWLGYGTTTGLAAIDWWLSDELLTPSAGSEQFSERVWRLPRASHCYQPPADAPAVAPPPACRAGTITFGSFNSLPKITARTVALWSAILRAVPDSRLLLKSWQLGDAGAHEGPAAAFAAHGVAPERIELRGFERSTASHLERYAEVDIALDPMPYNGATTTCEALWMGVPVLSVPGERMLGRFGLIHLHAADCEDFIAPDAAALVRQAGAMASDVPGLEALRAGLRERVARSSLCDAEAFGRAMGDALHGMWDQRAGT